MAGEFLGEFFDIGVVAFLEGYEAGDGPGRQGPVDREAGGR